LLREIIDLDATYKDDPIDMTEKRDEPEEEEDEKAGNDDDDEKVDGENAEEAEDEVNVSLAAMEEELAPQVFEIFGNIQKTYKKMQKVQTERLDALQKGKEAPEA